MAFDPRMEESWDEELRDTLQNMLGSSEQVVMAFFVEKSTSSWGIGGRRTNLTSKQRILALTVKTSSLAKKMKVRLQVATDSASSLKIEKVHNLSHLSKIKGVLDDKSGRSFILNFDLLQKQTVGPSPQWTMRNLDDRNRLLISIFKYCKNYHGRAPKITGIDVVEMQLWAQKYYKATPAEAPVKADAKAPVASIVNEEELVNDEGEEAETTEIARVDDDELVSKDEEEDMDALLGMYVLGIDEAEAFSERLKKELTALDTANVHAILENAPLVDEVTEQLDTTMGSIEDMEEWLGTINIKLRYMREDISSIESRNNSLETQARNSTALLSELHHISDQFRVPPEFNMDDEVFLMNPRVVR